MSRIFYKPADTDYTDSHTYYNASMVNVSEIPIEATYNDNRDEELIKDPEHWHISIERADIDALYIPIFHFVTGAYKVMLSYDTTVSQQDVIYVPEIPTNLDSLQPVYSINHFLRMVNTALQQAYNAIETAIPPNPTGNPTPPPTRPKFAPVFVYNPATKLFALIAETLYDSYVLVNPYPIKISVNTRLYNMLSGGWDAVYRGLSPPAGVLDYQIMVYNQQDNRIPLEILNPDEGENPLRPAYEMRAEYVTGNLKDAVKLILTTSMPIAREYIPSLEGSATTGANSTQAILTDFSIGSQPDDVGRPGYLYIPQYPRNIDLVGNIGIRNINISVFWQNRAGKVFPVLIPPHSAFNIKIAFKRKRSYDK